MGTDASIGAPLLCRIGRGLALKAATFLVGCPPCALAPICVVYPWKPAELIERQTVEDVPRISPEPSNHAPCPVPPLLGGADVGLEPLKLSVPESIGLDEVQQNDLYHFFTTNPSSLFKTNQRPASRTLT